MLRAYLWLQETYCQIIANVTKTPKEIQPQLAWKEQEHFRQRIILELQLNTWLLLQLKSRKVMESSISRE